MEKVSAARVEFLREDFRRGFVRFCGFRAVEVGYGVFESALTVTDDHKTQDNFIHAGVIATMSDHTAGYAAYTVVREDKRILTIEFKINFMRPAHGQALICRAELLSQGSRVIVAQSTVYDVRGQEEKMVSRSTITLMVIEAEKITDGSRRPSAGQAGPGQEVKAEGL
jgi:uncharacterized protein (TIGR00369 family)